MAVDELIDRAAAAVAKGYLSLDVTDAAGVLLASHYDGAIEQLAPMALELREAEVTPTVRPDGYQRELGAPEVERDPRVARLCEALHEHIEQQDGLLIETFWLSLATHLHRLLGVPVLVPNVEMPISEQLRRQRGIPMPDDALSGLNVVLSWPIDSQRVAAVWRIYGADLLGSARAPEDPCSIEWNTELGSEPEVRAGWLPPGAVAVNVRDRSGESHEAHTGDGAWLCVLPQRGGEEATPVVYRTVDGHEFRREIHVDVLPSLWPRQAGITPAYIDQRADQLYLNATGWTVLVHPYASMADTRFRPIAGTVLGRPHGLGVARTDRGWQAVASCGSFTVQVDGEGQPPERLDLDATSRPRSSSFALTETMIIKANTT